jgi:hypothetical protein
LNRQEEVKVVQAAISGHDGLVDLSVTAGFDSISISDSENACATSYRLSFVCKENNNLCIEFLTRMPKVQSMRYSIMMEHSCQKSGGEISSNITPSPQSMVMSGC